MLLIPKEEIAQIATEKIRAGGSMFGAAALLLNQFQIGNIAQQIAEEVTDAEVAEHRMLAEGEALEAARSE